MLKKRILFLCTHNSARSIIAEAIGNHLGSETVECFSAGTQPAFVRPLTLATLEESGIENLDTLHSKSINEFITQKFDFIITTCDEANENCPIFPGNAIKLHWGLPDPSQASGSEDEQLNEYRKVRDDLKKRITKLVLTFDKK